MTDEKIKELCKKIYQKHRDAIDLINQFKENSLDIPVDKFVDKNKNVEKVSVKSKSFWFIDRELKNLMPDNLMSNWMGNYPILLWFEKQDNNNKLRFFIEVGSFKNPKLRINLLKFLRDNGFSKIKDNSLRESSKYTRIYSKIQDFEDWQDDDAVFEKMDDMYNHSKTQSEIQKLREALKEYEWNE